jgi:prophage antirepressor-like protein
MNELTIFNYGRKKVRTVTRGGEIWFVAKDVAETLGYTWNGSARVEHVPAEWKKVTSVVTSRGVKEMPVLSEQGLYFFLGRSDKPAAIPMQKWVAGEVLPSIRKTGSYGKDPIAALNDPATMRGLLLTYSEKVIALESKVEKQAPKVDGFDRISSADGSMCITDAAKTLQVRPKDLFQRLSAQGWIYRRTGGKHWVGYQCQLKRGVLIHKVTILALSDGIEKVTEQVRITPKGLTELAENFSAKAA